MVMAQTEVGRFAAAVCIFVLQPGVEKDVLGQKRQLENVEADFRMQSAKQRRSKLGIGDPALQPTLQIDRH